MLLPSELVWEILSLQTRQQRHKLHQELLQYVPPLDTTLYKNMGFINQDPAAGCCSRRNDCPCYFSRHHDICDTGAHFGYCDWGGWFDGLSEGQYSNLYIYIRSAKAFYYYRNTYITPIDSGHRSSAEVEVCSCDTCVSGTFVETFVDDWLEYSASDSE